MIRARTKPRPGRLKGKDLERLRDACWIRDQHCKHCGVFTVPNAPEYYHNAFHMSHIKAKRMGGDSLENVETLCGDCHRKSHAYGPSYTKPCKAKERT